MRFFIRLSFFVFAFLLSFLWGVGNVGRVSAESLPPPFPSSFILQEGQSVWEDNGVLNSIAVTVESGEQDLGNDFDERLTSFTTVSMIDYRAETISAETVILLITYALLILTTVAIQEERTNL